MNLLRRFKNSISLRLVNVLGLSVMFACLLLSYNYIKKERSYDRYNEYADRIVRMSLQYNDDPVDGRFYSNNIDPVLQQIPEIEKVMKLGKIDTGVLNYQGKKQVLNNYYLASANFFDLFSIPLLHGEKDKVLQTADQAVISEKFAEQLFGTEQAVGKEINIDSRKTGGMTLFVSGVFKDFPEASHLHTDILIHRPDTYEDWCYVYLLLKEGTSVSALAEKITTLIKQNDPEEPTKITALLMPLTDIHLHSRVLRELELNGNIHYIYLVLGANLLLLVVVLFNLWLNASLIFSYSRRYYQLLRLNGASSFTVMKDETKQAMLLGSLSILTGAAIVYAVVGGFPIGITLFETIAGAFIFLFLIIFVSLLPVVKGISSSLFLNTTDDLKPTRFSYSNVKYMLMAQYAIVTFVIILAFGISKQMNLVKQSQLGGNDAYILVMKEQPQEVQKRYDVLKSELLKHDAIQAVTASFQLPGDAIRDATNVKVAGKETWETLSIMVVSNDFFPFFQIQAIAGEIFETGKLDFKQEAQRMRESREGAPLPDITEEYMLNRKALHILGFETPEEAIGKTLLIEHDGVGYINKGVVCGVTDDFNYTGLHNTAPPLLIFQRNLFLHCIMVRLDPERKQEALDCFNKTWNEINPDYPANYSFTSDVYGQLYHNELNAEKLVYIFSLLCLLIANLGLIIFMAFIIKRRTREIAIRKVNGAGIGEVIGMLNMNFIRWIALAFVIAIPSAWFVMNRWLENFAYRTSMNWWIFALAAFVVLCLSLLAVSLQSWRAATANPAKSIKTE